MLPATFGMILLAYPLNTIFYEPNVLGTRVLIEASLSGLVLGFFMLTASMLQGMYENKAAVQYLVIGFILKLILQVPFIFLFEVYGPLLSTTIALSVTCYLNVRHLHKMTRFNRMLTLRRIVLISLMTVILLIIAGISRLIFGQVFSVEHKGTAFLLVLLVGGIGGAAYCYMALKIRIADKLLGPGMVRLRRKLHIK
jgi:O-antigen/teichoic acid export membrane protein